MKVIDWKKFACFDYVNGAGSEHNPYELGYVVLNPRTKEIGVVIQVHDKHDIRTDMFGNSSLFEVVLADENEIALYRPDIFNDLYTVTCHTISHINYMCTRKDLPEKIYVWVPDHLNVEEKINFINKQITNETGFMNKGFVCEPKLR